MRALTGIVIRVLCGTCAVLVSAVTISSAARPGLDQRAYRISEVESLSVDMQLEFSGLQYLMTDPEQRAFLEAPSDNVRRDLIRAFWTQHDPEPTMPGNKMREEHSLRVRWARDDYGSRIWPGFDVRGEMLIRYGPPDYTGHVAGHIGDMAFRPPADLWYFKAHDMLIAFEDFEGKGYYKLALSSRGPLSYVTPQLVEFLLLDENPSYEGIIPSDLIDPEYMLPQNTKVTVETRSLMKKGRDMAGNQLAVFEDHVSTYPFNFEKDRRFPFFFDVVRFRGGNAGETRLDVACEVIIEADEEAPRIRTLSAAYVLYDETYREVDVVDSDIVINAADVTDGRLIPIQLTGTAARGRYHAAVSLLERETGRYSAFWTDVECMGFGDTLAVSDILFAQRISDADGDSPFLRGPLTVVPHPVRRYVRGSSVPVYFELYGLVPDDVGLTRYEIEYRIVPRRGSREDFWDRFNGAPTVVSSRFDGAGSTPTERLHFTVRTENLDDGLYDFLVSVKDTWAQSLAWREASFRIQQGAITLDEFKE